MRSTEKPAVWYVSLPSKGIQMKRKHGARGRLIRGRSSVHTRLSGGGSGADFRADFASRPSRCNGTETADGLGEQSCGDVHDDVSRNSPFQHNIGVGHEKGFLSLLDASCDILVFTDRRLCSQRQRASPYEDNHNLQ
jgi:hypothetical protein